MSFSVVLDTCVLYPAHLRDTLLRLSERDLYRALWSHDIIRELSRNLVGLGIAPEAVDHLTTEMKFCFPDAEVAGHGALVDSMTCDPKDRHILAAAVRSDAAAIVTFNIKDFPPGSTDAFEIDVIHPADFLLDLLDLAPTIVISELEQQATANRRDPKTLNTLLDVLTKAGVAGFADEVRRRTG